MSKPKCILLFLFSIIVLFLLGLFVYNIYQFISNSHSEKIKQWEFDRSKECGLLYDTVQHRPPKGYSNEFYIENVFYSPFSNSCLYIERNVGCGSQDCKGRAYYLVDAFTNELIYEAVEDMFHNMNVDKEVTKWKTLGLDIGWVFRYGYPI